MADAATTEIVPKSMRELRQEGRFDEAEDVARELLARPSVKITHLKEAAYLAYFRQDWPRAAQRYQRLLNRAPSLFSAKFYGRLYESYMEVHEPERALRCLMEGYYLYPVDPSLAKGLRARIAEVAPLIDEVWRPMIARRGPPDLAVHAGLYQLLFKKGYAVEAYRLKDICSEVYSAWPFEGLPAAFMYQKASASVFSGEFDRAQEWLSSQPWDRWKRERVQSAQLLAYCDLALGKEPRAVFKWLFEQEHPELPPPAEVGAPWNVRDFDRYFRGKSIAIVGPANTGQALADEIDTFDIVVRPNVFSFEDLKLSEERLGVRADVSYYTSAGIAGRKAEIYELARTGRIIPVLRRREHARIAYEECGVPSIRAVSPSPRNFVPVYSNSHAIQRMTWDLLKFSPSRLKVFNVNFYAGSLYDVSYRPKGAVPGANALGVAHDPLQSFLLSKMLYASGAAEFDPVAMDILRWSRQDYIDMLQRDFADLWRA